MQFLEMRNLLIENFNEITKDGGSIFQVLVDKDELYNLYLDSFPQGTNEIYRKNRFHDCSCCRDFIKRIGNTIIVKNNEVRTIWDFKTNDTTYQPVLDALNDYILKKFNEQGIEDTYFSTFPVLGCEHNFDTHETNPPKQWDHFYLELPSRFIVPRGKTKNSIVGDFRDRKNVFKRALEEFTLDAINAAIDLIDQNMIYRGKEWENQIKEFKKHKLVYDSLCEKEKDVFAWEQTSKINPVVCKIRNTSFGTFLINLSDGMDLEDALNRYETEIVAPANYKRPKAIFTQKMLDGAQKKITELGYLDSLPRRYATLDDITVNDILFANRDLAKRISGVPDVFKELSRSAKIKEPKLKNAEEISIDSFINEVLPSAKEVDLYFENKHASNLVSLIAPQNMDSKSMFKWGNNFSWSYSGNLTDSDIKENVKAAGGNVTGVLRFSIQWNDINTGCDNSDLDAHCKLPLRDKSVFITAGDEIFFNRKVDHTTGGNLDIDIQTPENKVAVENIIFPSKNKMVDGTYRFFVHQYQERKDNSHGFRAEIEFDGRIYRFDYPHRMHTGEVVHVASVTLKDGKFSIEEHIKSSIFSKEIWGIKTDEFIPVSVISYSPNFWENTENKIGHKHVFFMLKDCINDENPSGMFNEYLVQELYEYRKVMEALTSKMRVESSNDQLSGVGFATDRRAEVVVRVTSEETKKLYKINF